MYVRQGDDLKRIACVLVAIALTESACPRMKLEGAYDTEKL